MPCLFRRFLLLSLLTAWCGVAMAEDNPAAMPVLRIETGMHNAIINRIAVADDGRQLITVSDDKTARSWSLGDGSPESVWRTPIGPGDVGALYAVAATGDIVAVGGRTGEGKAALYILDRKSAHMRGSIGGFAEAISALAFSADGRFLAVGLQGSAGIVLVDFTAQKIVAQDHKYGGTVNWLAFGPDGSLAATSDDGKIRLYGPNLAEPALAGLSDDRPWGAAFSPDGKRLAIGRAGAAHVALFATAGLKLVQTLDGAPGRGGALSVVAWRPDGTALAAAGSYKDGEGHRLIRFWRTDAAVTADRDLPAAQDTVTDLALLPDGGTLYASAEPSFGVIGPDGGERIHRGADHVDFRDAWQDGFRVSRDGAMVEFPPQPGSKSRLRFDLVEGTLDVPTAQRPDLKLALPSDDRLKLVDWRNGTAPKLNGRAIPLQANEHVRSAAILPGDAGVALGSDFFLRLERAQGEAWQRVLPAPAWSVNVSGDGKYVLAALGDGTIRWYAAADGREVMNLFVDRQDRRWVVWVPDGYFDHSRDANGASGETLVGYHIDNGPGKAGDFVAIGQLYSRFYRRDLVLARFRGDGVATVGTERGGAAQTVLKTGLPPKLTLLEACIRAAGAASCQAEGAAKPDAGNPRRLTAAGGGAEFFARYQVEDQGGGLGRVTLRRNGAMIDGKRSVESEDSKARRESVILALGAKGGEFRFATSSANGAIQSNPADDIMIQATPSATADAGHGSIPAEPASDAELYIVAVGVSNYQQAEFRLANAANDAKAVGEMLQRPSPPVYARANAKLLLDNDATAANIEAALQSVAERARPQDIIVIYFSGHGEAIDGQYYFAPVDFAVRHQDLLAEARNGTEEHEREIVASLFREDGFGEAQLLPLLEKMQGNLLLVLDTCYSAALATSDAVEQKARNETVAKSVGHEIGRFILAGARSEALDSSGASGSTHGLFTTYLLKGLGGEADMDHAGKINVAELLLFTKSHVRDASRKLNLEQDPFYYFSGSNFFDVRAVSDQ
ncbi:MAG TPA: caspase family protein [Aliidongia sp.]|nr:caspase family protein [Aliidongia sp.]